MDAHSQKEIRLYAEVLFEVAQKVAPRCCESFRRHILGGVRFSGEELAELQNRLGTSNAASGNPGGLSGKALERFEEKLAGRKG